MPRYTVDIANEFITHLTKLEATRVKMENLLDNKAIDLDDIEQVYSGLYLDIFTSFEGLLEDLFFGLLLGEFETLSPDIACKVTSHSGPVARDLLHIGRSYLDWLPYDNTLNRANICFQNGIPFTRLDDGNKSNLQRYYRIRNAIAHKSKFSQKKFEDDVIGSSIVTIRERKPAGYLRGIFRTTQTRYQAISSELEAIALKICS